MTKKHNKKEPWYCGKQNIHYLSWKQEGPQCPRGLTCPPDLGQLRDRCLASICDYYTEGEVYRTESGKDYIFQDNGADILAVAHLDVVQPGPRHFGIKEGDSNKIYNAQLDDRLGAWIALDILPAIGVTVDVLLTEDEERCNSTAKYFAPPRPYRWMIEFDRAGTDVVLYDYETDALEEILLAEGNIVGWGTYSDIMELEHLRVAGFNWGIGYHHHHMPGAYFLLSEYMDAIRRFVRFYHKYKDTTFPFDPSKRPRHVHYYGPNQWDDKDVDWIGELEAQQDRAEFERMERAQQGDHAEADRAWDEYVARERRLERAEGTAAQQTAAEQWEEDRWGWGERLSATEEQLLFSNDENF